MDIPRDIKDIYEEITGCLKHYKNIPQVPTAITYYLRKTTYDEDVFEVLAWIDIHPGVVITKHDGDFRYYMYVGE